MAISRNRSAGAKVTDEEYTQLEALAQARGVALGEWCPAVLLRQLTPEAITSEGALLGEVLAVRMIVLNLFRSLANGGKLSDAKIQEIVQWADREKRTQAKDRLRNMKIRYLK